LLDLRRRTAAIVSGVIMEPALAGVHCHVAGGRLEPKNLSLLLIPKKSTP
jgi:hypothetical protein